MWFFTIHCQDVVRLKYLKTAGYVCISPLRPDLVFDYGNVLVVFLFLHCFLTLKPPFSMRTSIADWNGGQKERVREKNERDVMLQRQ